MATKRQSRPIPEIIYLEDIDLQSVGEDELLIPPHLLAFLNGLPTTADVKLGEKQLADRLKEALGGVDCVVIAVNYDCGERRFKHPVQEAKGKQYRKRGGRLAGHVSAQIPDIPPSERVAESMQEWGVDPSGYKDVVTVDYFHRESLYLGTVTLLRDKRKGQIEPATITLLSDLRPLLEFALSDLILRKLSVEQTSDITLMSLDPIIRDAHLTQQDEQILRSLFSGYTYQQTADRIGISIETVKKHMKRIYGKTGTDSLPGLFARYYSQRQPI